MVTKRWNIREGVQIQIEQIEIASNDFDVITLIKLHQTWQLIFLVLLDQKNKWRGEILIPFNSYCDSVLQSISINTKKLHTSEKEVLISILKDINFNLLPRQLEHLKVEEMVLQLVFLLGLEKNELVCSSCPFKNVTIDEVKLTIAKSYLDDRWQSPPTISILALEVGINECYLKRGFKELFGTTIFDYIQEKRFQKATYLLQQNVHTVSEVSELLGYSSPANFSSAFKKYVGVLPSEIKRGLY